MTKDKKYKYVFINPDEDYDHNKLWESFSEIGTILEQYVDATEELASITGNVFRSEEEREKRRKMIDGYRESKIQIASMLNSSSKGSENPGKQQEVVKDVIAELKDTFFKQMTGIANIHRAAENSRSMIISVINGILNFRIRREKIMNRKGGQNSIETEVKKIMLSSYLLIDSAIRLHNDLLASLFVIKTELERQNQLIEDGESDDRFVWDHSGQRVPFPYAVSMLMVDLETFRREKSLSKVINLVSEIMSKISPNSKEILQTGTDAAKRIRSDVLSDLASLYENYSMEEIEREADKFARHPIFMFMKLRLPDEETIALAMEREHEAVSRLALYKEDGKTISAEDVNKKYGYEGIDSCNDCDIDI